MLSAIARSLKNIIFILKTKGISCQNLNQSMLQNRVSIDQTDVIVASVSEDIYAHGYKGCALRRVNTLNQHNQVWYPGAPEYTAYTINPKRALDGIHTSYILRTAAVVGEEWSHPCAAAATLPDPLRPPAACAFTPRLAYYVTGLPSGSPPTMHGRFQFHTVHIIRCKEKTQSQPPLPPNRNLKKKTFTHRTDTYIYPDHHLRRSPILAVGSCCTRFESYRSHPPTMRTRAVPCRPHPENMTLRSCRLCTSRFSLHLSSPEDLDHEMGTWSVPCVKNSRGPGKVYYYRSSTL